MKLFLRNTVLVVLVALALNSCSKTNKDVKMIPNDALMVVQLDTKSLLGKLPWNKIKETSWFKKVYSDTVVKAWTKKIMDDPAATGIDLDAPLVIFIQKTGGENQVVFEGSIKNTAAFKDFNKNLDPQAVEVKEGEITVLNLKEKSVVGLDDKKFAYVMNAPKTGSARFSETTDSPQLNNGQSINTVLALSTVCKRLFTIPADSSMVKNEKFSKLLKESGEVHVWQNNEQLVKNSVQMGMLSMLKIDAFLKGNITTATASFDNGKISLKQKFYASPELTDLLKKYDGGKVNTGMIKNIPSKNVVGFLALNFKPEALRDIVKLTGMDGLVNSSLSQQGLTMDDFIKANKGDVLFALTDYELKKDSFNFKQQSLQDTSYTYSKPTAKYMFAVSIGDKAAFDKLSGVAAKMGSDVSNSLGIFFKGNDKIFAAANSEQYVNSYLAGSNNSFDFIDKISGHPIAFFVDINKILVATAPLTNQKDTSSRTVFDESLKMWQSIYAIGGEFKDDAFIMTTEIDLVNKNTNSLELLNTYLDKISAPLIEKKNQYQGMQIDSATAYPPMSGLDTVK